MYQGSRWVPSVCVAIAIAITLLPVSTAGPTGGCPPLAGAMDSFPSTATLVIQQNGFGEPFVVRLSSAGLPNAVVQRGPQVADVIGTEMLSLELNGFHPRVGSITLRESSTQPSVGQITEVVLDGACNLIGGISSQELFVEIEMTSLGETWIPQSAVPVVAALSGLTPQPAFSEIPRVDPIVLEDQATNELRGQLYYLRHETDPALPEPDLDCSDSLITADVHLFGLAQTANLIGFGPLTVERGPVLPGGTCTLAGNPCDDDLDCALLDTCVRQNIETEIVALEITSTDGLLGDWQLTVRPERGDSDCCVEHLGLGCSDATCESLICGLDSFCCTFSWDDICAKLAESEPLCADNCDDPNATPTLGTVRSVELDRSYPMISVFDGFFRLTTSMQGVMHNEIPLSLRPLLPIANLPPDPATEFLYVTAPIPMLDEEGIAVGEISNVVHTLQPPFDCFAPPAAAEECFVATVRLVLDLPGCAVETIAFSGSGRMLRDDPDDGVGLGQELIDLVVAGGEFSGAGGCTGALTLRLVGGSVGAISSLAPEEFFPADSTFDVQVEIGTPGGTLTGGPLWLSTSINALPTEVGELHLATNAPVDLRDETTLVVGQILDATQLVDQQNPACPAGFDSEIDFAGPTKDDLDVSIPGNPAGVVYDVVRGDLATLHATSGSFASATCLLSDVGPNPSDFDLPTSGEAFYYLARAGLGAFAGGSWNGSAPPQQGDRDATIPSCP